MINREDSDRIFDYIKNNTTDKFDFWRWLQSEGLAESEPSISLLSESDAIKNGEEAFNLLVKQPVKDIRALCKEILEEERGK